MSIADELNHLSGDIGDAYDAVNDMGGVIPAAKNMDNLDTAIRTIPQPTVNDGTLTIQKNGTNVATFTANQASNATANITVPVNTSDLNNDSGFITSSDLPGDMTGASAGAAGAHGLVPAPSAGDENKVLSGAGTWVAVSSGGSYSAGNGISIDANNEISIDSSVVAEVSDIPTQTSDLTNDGADGTSTYVEADELATVATSGSYNDLSNKPTIPAAQVNSDWNAASGVAEILNKPNLATVATSGSYTDLTNTPSIPAAQVNSDWNAVSGVAEILNKPSLAAVATTGAYSDLSGTPTIPTVNDAALTITQNGTSVGTFTANASSNATIALTDTTYSAMTGATSGTAGTSGLVPAPAAGDESKVLSGAGTWVNQPTVPTVNDGTLTIQQNGTTVGTFTANQSTASTVNIETIYADTPGTATNPTGWVNTSEIVDGAVTNAKMSITYQYVDTGERKLTVAESGLYFIFAQHTMAGPSDAKSVDIRVDGTLVSQLVVQQSSGSIWSNATPTLIRQLTAGSVVSLNYNDSIVTDSGTSAQRSHLGMIRIA